MNQTLEIDHRYRLQERLGAGGMGEVYRARDRLTGEAVALKRVTAAVEQLDLSRWDSMAKTPTATLGEDVTLVQSPDESGLVETEPELVRALALEFQTLASLRHPNIISVLDYGFDRGESPYYTMELLEQPKTVLEAAKDASLERKVELLVEVLRALAYLHRRGIVHRDLKPANVLVNGELKVLDFGLAMRPDRSSAEVAGTLSYIAPEVLRGMPASAASDLYAVGLMAYQILSGRYPFDRSDRRRLIDAHLRTEPDFSGLDVGDELIGVVRRLLDKQERRRWQRADEVIDALGEAAGMKLARETRATRESFLQAAEFVDRVEERTCLVDALAKAIEGRGGLVLVEGQSGLGKSRLLDELRAEALVRGARVVEGQASEHREPFHLWREPLRRLVLSTVLSDEEGGVLKLLLPDLEELVERQLPDVELSPQTARQQMLDVILAVFERQKEPLLVLLEDLHWAPDSTDLLRDLSWSLIGLPLLIVGSYRGEEATGLAGELPEATRLHLEPLAKRDIAELAKSMLGPRGDRDQVVEFLQRHTEGNVFFIVETVRALAEEAGDLGRVGAARLPEQISAGGVEAIVERRLKLVPADRRTFLDCAAVQGREIDPRVLAEALGRRAVSEGLSGLSDLALLEVRDNAWRFAHEKFRAAILAGMPAERRWRLHRHVGEAMEKVYGASEEQAALLAYHFNRAGDAEKEASYSALGGLAALKQGAYADARALLERALELEPRLAEADADRKLDLLLHLGSVLIATRGWSAPEVKRLYDEAVELGQEVGRQSQVAPGLIGLSKFSFLRGELARSRELARRCLELAEASGDPVIRQHARLMEGEVGVWLGEFHRDRDYADEIAALYEPGQAAVHLSLYGQNPRLTCLVSTTVGTWMLGYPDKALRRSREALSWAKEEANPFSLAIAYQISSWLHQLRQEVRETRAHARELATLSDEHGFPPFEVLAQALAGWVEARRGDVERGVGRLRAALARWPELGARLATTYYSMLLADACLQGGLVEEGLAVASRALDGSLGTEETCYAAELERLRGELWRSGGDLAAAEQAFERALELAARQQAKSFELRAATSRARMLGGSSRREASRERLADLVEWLSDKGDSPDLRAAKELLAGGEQEEVTKR